MFDNIGGKIKVLAVVVTIIGCIVSFVFGIILFVEGEVGMGFLVIIMGGLLSWVSSFVLYGFGELIESNQNIQKTNKDIYLHLKSNNDSTTEEKMNQGTTSTANNTSTYKSYLDEFMKKSPAPAGKKKSYCPDCGKERNDYDTMCNFCGYKFL